MYFTDLYGNGDNKSHKFFEDYYAGIKVQKRECIGDVQKHMGNRLRKSKQRVKGLRGKGNSCKIKCWRLGRYEKSLTC